MVPRMDSRVPAEGHLFPRGAAHRPVLGGAGPGSAQGAARDLTSLCIKTLELLSLRNKQVFLKPPPKKLQEG